MHVFKGSSGEGRKSAHVRGRSRWFSVLTALALVATLGLAGCSDGGGFDGLPIGTWSGNGDSYTISRTSITYQSNFGPDRVAILVSVADREINGGDLALGGNVSQENTMNPGYAIIRYSEPTELNGKFNVFRWGDLPDGSGGKYLADWNQGEDGGWQTGAFATAAEARDGATITRGSWFMGTYSLSE